MLIDGHRIAFGLARQLPGPIDHQIARDAQQISAKRPQSVVLSAGLRRQSPGKNLLNQLALHFGIGLAGHAFFAVPDHEAPPDHRLDQRHIVPIDPLEIGFSTGSIAVEDIALIAQQVRLTVHLLQDFASVNPPSHGEYLVSFSGGRQALSLGSGTSLRTDRRCHHRETAPVRAKLSAPKYPRGMIRTPRGGARGAALAVMIAGWAWSGPVGGQTPAAPIPTAGVPDARGVTYRYALGADGNLALGAVDRFMLTIRGDGQFTTPIWGYYVEPRWTHAKVAGNKTDSEWYLRNVVYLFPRDLVHGFAVGMFERSLRRRYDYRLTGGAGLGVNLVREEHVDVSVAQGLVYETTGFYVADYVGYPEETERTREVVRSASRLSGRLRAGGRTALFLDAYLKPAVTDPKDYRILAKGSLELAIGKGLAVRALLDYTRETFRVVGTSKNELMLTFGVGIRRD